MQEKPIHNKYNGNKNTKNKNFNRHRSTHKNYKNTKHNKTIDTKVYALGGLNEIGKICIVLNTIMKLSLLMLG